MSRFDEWFLAKYGSRPKMDGVRDADLEQVILKGREAKRIAFMQEMYDRAYESAKEAWSKAKKN